MGATKNLFSLAVPVSGTAVSRQNLIEHVAKTGSGATGVAAAGGELHPMDTAVVAL